MKAEVDLSVTERHLMGYSTVLCRARMATERLGHSPSKTEYEQLGILPSVRMIERNIGWNRGKRELGLAVDDRSPRTFSPADCLFSVAELTYELGYSPTVVQYREHDRHPNPKTITTKVARWTDTRRVAEMCVTTSEDSEIVDSLDAAVAIVLDAIKACRTDEEDGSLSDDRRLWDAVRSE